MLASLYRLNPQTREGNLKLIFNLINSRNDLTRADLVRITGLSPSTISTLTDALIKDGLISETGVSKVLSSAGRRPLYLSICPESRQIPVFSISRSGVEYTLFDLGYNVLAHNFYSYPRKISRNNNEIGQHSINLIADILLNKENKLDRSRAVGILISFPGAYFGEDELYILTALKTSIRKSAIDTLSETTGLKVYMGNCSKNLAYAEIKQLDASGSAVKDLIYVNICDGVGAGMIQNGEMLSRSDLVSGAIGHITIVPGGRKCDCGNRGCLEQYVDARAIIKDVQKALAHNASTPQPFQIISDLSAPFTLETVGRAYDLGIAPVQKVVNDVARKLFSGICSAVCVTGIKYIVIGGLEPLGFGFLSKMQSLLDGECSRVLMRGVQIMYPKSGKNADSLGLAQYYIDKEFCITV